MTKIKVSAVSYTNSKPFVYGIMHSGVLDQIDLSLDIPSVCANKLIALPSHIGELLLAIAKGIGFTFNETCNEESVTPQLLVTTI